MKNEKRVKAGKRSRQLGNNFEKKVREDLESKGYIVDKWTNNVNLFDDGSGELKPVKPKWINGRIVMNSGGFPDFIRWRKGVLEPHVEAVESKMDGKLDKEEIQKCRWLLSNGVFSKIYIADKQIFQRRIVPFYTDFEEKYGLTEEEA